MSDSLHDPFSLLRCRPRRLQGRATAKPLACADESSRPALAVLADSHPCQMANNVPAFLGCESAVGRRACSPLVGPMGPVAARSEHPDRMVGSVPPLTRCSQGTMRVIFFHSSRAQDGTESAHVGHNANRMPAEPSKSLVDHFGRGSRWCGNVLALRSAWIAAGWAGGDGCRGDHAPLGRSNRGNWHTCRGTLSDRWHSPRPVCQPPGCPPQALCANTSRLTATRTCRAGSAANGHVNGQPLARLGVGQQHR